MADSNLHDAHVRNFFGREAALSMLRSTINAVEEGKLIFVSGEKRCSIIKTYVEDKELPLLDPHQSFLNMIFDFSPKK